MAIRFTRTIPVLLVLSLLAFPACSGGESSDETAADVAAEMESAAQSAGEAAMHAADDLEHATREFLEDSGQELDELQERVAALEAEGAESTRSHWQEVKERASELADDIGDDLDRLADATGDEAEDIRADIHEKRIELRRWMHEARLSVIHEKDEFIAEANRYADALGAELDALGDRADELGDDTLDELRSLHDEAKEKASSLADSVDEGYHDAKRDLSRHLSDLRHRLDRLTGGE